MIVIDDELLDEFRRKTRCEWTYSIEAYKMIGGRGVVAPRPPTINPFSGGTRFMANTILLTRGLTTIVDEADFEALNRFKWYASKRSHSGIFYAATSISRKFLYMHRLLAGALPGQCVDHINGDSLDNRRLNLRIATRAENQMNQKGHGGTSRFKGVHPSGRGTWVAQITFQRKCRHIGVFHSEEEAAIAYDAAARALHKDFARLNFPAT